MMGLCVCFCPTLSEDDPVPRADSGEYLAQMEECLTWYFRVGFLEIIFGTLLAFFSPQLYVYPAFVAIIAIILGINAVCHFRDYAQIRMNGCCCPPLASVSAHGLMQPILLVLCIAVVATGGYVLSSQWSNFDGTDVAMVAVGMTAAFLLMLPAAVGSAWSGRLRALVEIHPDMGDPDLARAHHVVNNLDDGGQRRDANGGPGAGADDALARAAAAVLLAQTVERMTRIAERERANNVNNPLWRSVDDDHDDDNDDAAGEEEEGAFAARRRALQEEDDNNAAFAAHRHARALMMMRMQGATPSAPIDGVVVGDAAPAPASAIHFPSSDFPSPAAAPPVGYLANVPSSNNNSPPSAFESPPGFIES